MFIHTSPCMFFEYYTFHVYFLMLRWSCPKNCYWYRIFLFFVMSQRLCNSCVLSNRHNITLAMEDAPFSKCKSLLHSWEYNFINLWVVLIIGMTNCGVVMLTVATCAGPKHDVGRHVGNANKFFFHIRLNFQYISLGVGATIGFPHIVNNAQVGYIVRGANHTNHIWHHPSTYLTVIVWKMMGQHLFLNIIPDNFTIGAG
jgi:hypothetical protein